MSKCCHHNYNNCYCNDCCNRYPIHPVQPILPPQPAPLPLPTPQSSAQFISTDTQRIDTRTVKFVQVPVPIVQDHCGCIKQIDETTIQLERGRYSVDYYITVRNRRNETGTFRAALFLNDMIRDYTISRVRLDPRSSEEDDFIDFLTKTNLIEVTNCSTLKLGVSVANVGLMPEVRYDIRDASIVITKLDC